MLFEPRTDDVRLELIWQTYSLRKKDNYTFDRRITVILQTVFKGLNQLYKRDMRSRRQKSVTKPWEMDKQRQSQCISDVWPPIPYPSSLLFISSPKFFSWHENLFQKSITTINSYLKEKKHQEHSLVFKDIQIKVNIIINTTSTLAQCFHSTVMYVHAHKNGQGRSNSLYFISQIEFQPLFRQYVYKMSTFKKDKSLYWNVQY